MSTNSLIYFGIAFLFSCSTNVQENQSSTTQKQVEDVSEDNNTIVNTKNTVNSTEKEIVNTEKSTAYKQDAETIYIDFKHELFITESATYTLEGFRSTQNLPTQSTHIAKYSTYTDSVEYIPMKLYNNFPKSGLKFFKGIEACKVWGHVTDTVLNNIDGEDSIISHIESYELSIDINNKLIIDTLP